MAEGKKGVVEGIVEGELKGAPKGLLEDMFEDYYNHRVRLYFMNLARGIFFGFGAALGGTLGIAVLLWVLSWLNFIPFLSDIIKAVENTLRESR